MIRWAMVTAVAIGMVVAAACGSADDATPLPVRTASKSPSAQVTAYFTNYKQINADALARIQQLDTTYPQAFHGDLAQTQDSFREYLKIFDDTDGLYQALNVPADLRSVQDRILAADADGSVISHQRLTQLEAATDYSQVDTIFAVDQRFTDAAARGGAACRELLSAAADYGIAFDVPCGS